MNKAIECNNSAILRHAHNTVLAFISDFTDSVHNPASCAEGVTAGECEGVSSSVIETYGTKKGFGCGRLPKLLGGFTGAGYTFGAIGCWM